MFVAVRSDGCTTDCGPDDTYRLRARETTATVPRFNNSCSQLTVLVLQNVGATTVAGKAIFWSPAGVLVGEQAFTISPRASAALDT